jgi:hypothetical protein
MDTEELVVNVILAFFHFSVGQPRFALVANARFR